MFDKLFSKKNTEESTEETVENQEVSEPEVELQKTDEKIDKKEPIEGLLTFHNLVDWFGDKKVVAEIVNVEPTTVSMWRKRGVPQKYYARFREAMKN